MRYFLSILISLLFCFQSPLGASEAPPEADLASLLAGIGTTGGWSPEGEPALAAGDDLFLLINGGAEIYHEYGFTKAIFQTYAGPDGRAINLELYQMNDPAAAFGIYTFKTGAGGTPVAVGAGGSLESYYLNFWKGRFLATVIALDTGGDASADLIALARAIDAVLPGGVETPPIVAILHDAADIVYLRGNLALFNWYQFDTDNIFGLREGAAGRYEDHSVLLIRYETAADADRGFENAKSHLRSSDRFDGFTGENARFGVTDREGTLLSCARRSNWIAVLFASGDRPLEPGIDAILRRAASLKTGAESHDR